MITETIRAADDNVDEELTRAAEALRNGEVVAFPTETVYGLGANALIEDAVREVFKVKGRPADNPLIVHLADPNQLPEICRDIPETAMKLFHRFSPGPLTLVLKRHPNISDAVTAGLDTVAVRFPEHPIARKLIRLSGVPVVAPSANLSGSPSPTRAWHVEQDFTGAIPFIIDGGSCRVGIESTVVDMTGDIPVILRPGAVTEEMIRDELGIETGTKTRVTGSETPKAPGMKYRHYAPRADVYILDGDFETMRKRMIELGADATHLGLYLNGGFAGDAATAAVIADLRTDRRVDLMTYRDDGTDAMHDLFNAFRVFDRDGADRILVTAEPEHDAGTAYMNRLRKAANKTDR